MEDGNEHHTRNLSIPWKRREPGDSGKDRGTGRERRSNQGRIRNGGGKEDRKCHGCGKVRHLVAQRSECGNEGHIARQCPYMNRRAETGSGEPMEINFQRIQRRRREDYRPSESSSETLEASEASGTEREGRGGRSNKPPSSSWRRVCEGRRSRQES
ncbi:uncharacterized protein [Halyomorpha halys]|uniref:uncharacterized protein n=1 Tax=Halyomorpha halys TaxID=286706 RepID=UPI0034D287E2